MEPLHALLFDDDVDELQSIREVIELHWESLLRTQSRLPPIEITEVTTMKDAMHALREHPGRFAIFFCDIYVQHKDRAESSDTGLVLLRLAKTEGQVPVAIGVSNGPLQDIQRFSTKMMGEVDVGRADKFIFKQTLRGQEGLHQIEDIAHLLDTKGLLVYEGKLVFEDTWGEDFRLAAVLETIGEQTLLAAASHFSSAEYDEVSISSLQPGLSGAYVLRAAFKGKNEDLGSRQVLLKVSRDIGKLRTEIDNYREWIENRRAIESRLCVPFLPGDQPISVRGWGILGAHFSKNSHTLVDWLAESNPSSNEIDNVLSELMLGDGLANTYSSSRKKIDDCSIARAIHTHLLSNFRAMSIKLAIREFGGLIKKHWCEPGEFDEDLLLNFIVECRVGTLGDASLPKKWLRCFSHGDFHARNVLVETTLTGARPRIIDFGNLRDAVWATDIVRLIVDLTLSGWGTRDESHEWNSLRDWRPLIDLLEGKAAKAKAITAAQKNSLHAVSWLRSRAFQIYGIEEDSYHQAQLSLALSAELMRAAYRREDLPPPKRAFGLVAACYLMRAADRLFRDSRPAVR